MKHLIGTLLFIYCHNYSCAQSDISVALRVGDSIPESLWQLPLQVVNHPLEKDTITLREYRERKLIVLDFWATWCTPCIKSLSELDPLQKQLKDELAVIPVTSEESLKAADFFRKNDWSLPTVVLGASLKEYFPHKSIPHQVWVHNGKVMAVTGPQYATREIISEVLAGKKVKFLMKEEITEFDKRAPLLFNGNGIDASNMLYHSLFTKRLKSNTGGRSVGKDYFMLYNATVRDMVWEGYSRYIPYYGRYNRIVFELPDSVRHRIYYHDTLPDTVSQFAIDSALKAWQDSNVYCYNLRLPRTIPGAEMRSLFLQDLKRFLKLALSIDVTLEKRTVLSYVLQDGDVNRQRISSGTENYRFDPQTRSSSFSNKPVSYIFTILAGLNAKSLYPFVNEAKDRKVDIDFEGDMKDLSQVVTVLEKNGLKLSVEERQLDMIVVRKAGKL